VTINCAAATNPAMAELTPEAALLTNREGPARLARACLEIGCRIIHLSTVDVFDGRKPSAYTEEDPPVAATSYAKSRYLGELGVGQDNPDHLVVRLSMLCGDGDPEDPLWRIREAIGAGVSLPWGDRRVSPIFAEDLASAILTILRSGWRGVLHLANGGSCLLSELVEEVNRLEGDVRVPALIGGVGPASFWEGGGPNAALDSRRFASLSGRRLRDWQTALFAVASGPGGR
jgi:dTDP-4-dehydrorhamnose reductase